MAVWSRSAPGRITFLRHRRHVRARIDRGVRAGGVDRAGKYWTRRRARVSARALAFADAGCSAEGISGATSADFGGGDRLHAAERTGSNATSSRVRGGG